MAEHQQRAHLLAEIVALISGVLLVVVSYRLPPYPGWIIRAAGFGVVVVDCFFISSWKIVNRPRWFVDVHIIAEIIGVLCGMMLIYLAFTLEWSIKALYIFCTGTAMCVIDAMFVITWIRGSGFHRTRSENRGGVRSNKDRDN